ncbi:quinone-dependent dihydroorotate dehydrogenase [Neisseria sp. Ec49-e6-T10]|uniref:quinone-dependent dihydroorotate dehydrogenase n=1 Tax=Neisseria sp. Ec49-e6-T10 TaxID=3140744 RepID=UPI003EB7658B
MYKLIQPLLFRLDAEKAHTRGLALFKKVHQLGLASLIPHAISSCPLKLMGLDLPNPIGTAAGLDKNGAYIDALASLGFGFLEVGTVTPKPQSGNDKPRLFRLIREQAIINRMGFNNDGIDVLIENIKKSQYKGVLGINIGKNATTPIEKALDDYLICLEKAYPFASYIAINISSPNTQNLRSLQSEHQLEALLSGLKAKQLQLADQYNRYVPLVVKIAPDMDEIQIAQLANVLIHNEIDGVIATNTTIDKSMISAQYAQEQGGLSGYPLKEKSNQVLQLLSKHLQNKVAIIGVGGIMTGNDAVKKLELGAQAVQLYSGLVFQGTGLVENCIQAILKQQNKI